MQFESFDKKVKEAAEHHHPAYDEKAWEKMEKLLDEHLPQKKDDRRRIIFFLLLFFCLLGGISYILIGKPWKTNKAVTRIEKKTSQKIPADNVEKKSLQDQSVSNTALNKNNNLNENQDNRQEPVKNEETSLKQINTSKPRVTEAVEQKQDSRIKRPEVAGLLSKDDQPEQTKSSNSKTVTPFKNNDNEIVSAPVKNDQQIVASNENLVTKPITDNVAVTKTEIKDVVNNSTEDINKKDEIKANKQPEKKNIGKNKEGGIFSFSVSAGPDVSKAGGSSLSKATLSYGAGISYTLKKFTLRSGFYVAKKVYNAGANDYKLDHVLPAGIKFLNTDADCKVYEIPLSLTYNISAGKKSSWYAGIGLSSYLMQNEKYKNWYQYTSSGVIYPRNYTYNNKNKHYFSVLDLSAGYTRKLNNTFSISAEPYLKIPLQGIGEGKVHLNSAGVLFSVGIKPFKQKKSK